MLTDEKILVTGAAGHIAFPLVQYLAKDNEVWGIARFSGEGAREKVEAAGAVTRVVDLGDADFSELPDDFTYVLHLAASIGPGLDYDGAIRTNAEGTGLLFQHCRKAKAVLSMSTHSVYKPVDDPAHVFKETDPLGDVNALFAPTYSVSKIGEEVVARYCARAFNLPVIICRMNAAYASDHGLPMSFVDNVVNGEKAVTRWDPCYYSPIHQDDINSQTEALLHAASVPATIVNWAGDEPMTVQELCAYVGEQTGREAKVEVQLAPGTLRGSIADDTKRASITGPCKVGWKAGIRRMLEDRHPDALVR